MMRDQTGYHILIGKRYVRWPHEWLKPSAHGFLLAQQPLPDTMIDGEALARRILERMLGAKELSNATKAKLGMQRIQVRTLEVPDEIRELKTTRKR